MKSQSTIEHRIRGLLCEELTRRVKEAETRLPHLCLHNYRQPLDPRKLVDGESNDSYNRISDRNGLPVVQTMGLCMLGSRSPSDWPGNICEDPIDAQRCPYFSSIRSKAAIYQLFKENMGDVSWVRDNMPELHSLLWVLEAAATPPLPWWKRVWFRFRRIRVEPVAPTVTRLLPPAEE